MEDIQYQSYDDELAARALDSGATIMISTTDGAGVSFPAPRPAPLPPMVTTAPPPANQGNQKVLIGGLAIVLIILASVGLRSHGE